MQCNTITLFGATKERWHTWLAIAGRGVRRQWLLGLQTQCGVNFFILDLRRVLAPAPKVLGPKHISNPDFAPF